MPTSNSYSFDLSTSGIIRVAYQRVGGIVAAGEDPDQNQYAMGRDFLQVVLTAMQAEGIQLRSVLRTTDNLVAGTAQYTCSSNVIDIDERTPYISNSANIDLPLRKISRGEYMALSNKNTQAPPTMFYVEKAATVSYFLYPTPDSTYTTITYPAIVLQPDMTDGAVTSGLASRYLDTVTLRLAVMLAGHFTPVRVKALRDEAEVANNRVNNDDTERGPIRLKVEPPFRFNRRW